MFSSASQRSRPENEALRTALSEGAQRTSDSSTNRRELEWRVRTGASAGAPSLAQPWARKWTRWSKLQLLMSCRTTCSSNAKSRRLRSCSAEKTAYAELASRRRRARDCASGASEQVTNPERAARGESEAAREGRRRLRARRRRSRRRLTWRRQTTAMKLSRSARACRRPPASRAQRATSERLHAAAALKGDEADKREAAGKAASAQLQEEVRLAHAEIIRLHAAHAELRVTADSHAAAAGDTASSRSVRSRRRAAGSRGAGGARGVAVGGTRDRATATGRHALPPHRGSRRGDQAALDRVATCVTAA